MRRDVLALLAALLALPACRGADEHREVDAAADAACHPDDCRPYACDPVGGGCFRVCAGAGMCAPGFQCTEGACVGTECTAETRAERCGAYACLDGVCATDCAVGPCAEGYYCRGDTSTCMPRCTHRGDPSCGGYVCDTTVGECESYCRAGEVPCAAGFACSAADTCVEDTAAPACASGCGTYACVTALGRCATHCVEDDDCAGGATCTQSVCS